MNKSTGQANLANSITGAGREIIQARTQHTPGPWSNDGQREHVVAMAPDGTMRNDQNSIAICYGPDCQANARLIASAPELLEALKKMLNTRFVREQVELVNRGIGTATDDGQAIILTFAAIAKSE